MEHFASPIDQRLLFRCCISNVVLDLGDHIFVELVLLLVRLEEEFAVLQVLLVQALSHAVS